MMFRLRSRTTLPTALTLAALLAACGQRGPLFLPEDGGQPVPTAAQESPPTPAATDESREDEPADEVFADDFDTADDGGD